MPVKLNLLKYRSDQKKVILVKEKLLVNFIGITSLFSLFYITISAVISYRPGVIVMSVNFILFLINLWLVVKKKMSYHKAANFYIGNCTFVAILLCTFFSGGLFSPVLPWFILIPTISLLLLGIGRATWFWLLVVFSIIVVFGMMGISGYEFPMAYNTAFLNFFTLTCLAGLVLIVYIVTMVFERAKETAMIQLAERNKEITDSIHYAKRIQETLLAPKEFIDRHFPENFVLFKPKDIVSGDFYWATEKEHRVFMAVCDCTGHGVPGAFMSLLITNLLHEAIDENGILEPHLIFNQVRKRLIENISKDGSKDGMDGIIFCLDKNTGHITYASANSNQVLVRDSGLVKLPKDKMPVGLGERNESFRLYSVTVQKGDILYLYSDGFADMFGGPKGKKFTHKQLNEKLLQLSGLTLQMQGRELEKVMHGWKGDLEQVDDICVIGLKL